MKYLIIILISITLSGCFWQTANNIDLQKAVYLCGSIENVQEINVRFDSVETIICANGDRKTANDIKLPKENN